ncbi:hypothetical protein N7532_005740 [Penicillium argentinense]|uniref:Uncharacterized protein n=1 Tax=Penicillium argentinense TaxID=1131581 RepID=A0A9W9FEK5_9EURO|nr:uncharacterized protein N7532_005740 [Penicillium argentinense]KAJ5098739.1 hypothetical protein N7532_005740 [Penicillium argentinense]
MCHITYHHFPGCGHIANVTATTCLDFTHYLRSQPDQFIKCEDAEIQHDLLADDPQVKCRQCITDSSVTEAGASEPSSSAYHPIEGLDANSLPFEFAVCATRPPLREVQVPQHPLSNRSMYADDFGRGISPETDSSARLFSVVSDNHDVEEQYMSDSCSVVSGGGPEHSGSPFSDETQVLRSVEYFADLTPQVIQGRVLVNVNSPHESSLIVDERTSRYCVRTSELTENVENVNSFSSYDDPSISSAVEKV